MTQHNPFAQDNARAEMPRTIHDWMAPLVSVDGHDWPGYNLDTLGQDFAGACSYNTEDVFYFGALAVMPATEYLRAARVADEPRDNTIDHFRQCLREGTPFASPFLKIQRDRDNGGFAVSGHEGRHRALALMLENPNALMPVALIGQGELRARHLTAEDLASMGAEGPGLGREDHPEEKVALSIPRIWHEHTDKGQAPIELSELADRERFARLPLKYHNMLISRDHNASAPAAETPSP